MTLCLIDFEVLHLKFCSFTGLSYILYSFIVSRFGLVSTKVFDFLFDFTIIHPENRNSDVGY